MVRGGLTLFPHRFLVDFDAQYAFNGSDSAKLRDAAFIAQEENFEQNGGEEYSLFVHPVDGSFAPKGKLDIHYNGSSVGTNYTWGIKTGSVDGLLPGNIGLALVLDR